MKKTSFILSAFMGLALTVTGVAALTPMPDPFKDIPEDHWSLFAVDWAKSFGVMKGYEDETFRGDNPTSRYELAQVLSNYDTMTRSSMNAMKANIETLKIEMATMKLEMDKMKLAIDPNYFPVVDVDSYYGVEHLGAPVRYVCESKADGSRIYYHETVPPNSEERFYDEAGKKIEGAVETENCKATTIEFYDSKVEGNIL